MLSEQACIAMPGLTLPEAESNAVISDCHFAMALLFRLLKKWSIGVSDVGVTVT